MISKRSFYIAFVLLFSTLFLHFCAYMLIGNDSNVTKEVGIIIAKILMNTIYQPWSGLFERFDLWAVNETWLYVLLIALNSMIYGVVISSLFYLAKSIGRDS